MRRLTRRMQLNRIERIEDYAAFLRENAEEIQTLFSDLMISVTMRTEYEFAFESAELTAKPLVLAATGKKRAPSSEMRWFSVPRTSEQLRRSLSSRGGSNAQAI